MDFTARSCLQTEYAKRRERRPRFSLRAFARELALPSGRLSELLSGKRPITPELGLRLADRLALAPDQREEFLRGVAAARGGGATAGPEFRQLSADAFHLISDWYHFALLHLTETA